jgi:ubiquinone/menaquinone biosynthesis C-methylase UbiE
MRVSLLPVLLRETLGARTLPREPEPDLVMEGPEQVAAFAEAGRIDGVMAASYLFNSARISQVIHGCRSVIDLGCGPATQLAQVAALNPQIDFLGVDLSAGMLANAEAHVREAGLTNVRFARSDITLLDELADQSADGVISTLALHHLPTHDHLRACFAQIRRVLKPGGAVYLIDLGRLKSLRSVLFFAYANARHQPHVFSLDYERSLRAAFLQEDFEILSREYLPEGARVYSPLGIPVLLLIKTPDRSLPPQLRSRLREMRRELHSRYRGDLDDIRLFFRLGGLADDPFRAD